MPLAAIIVINIILGALANILLKIGSMRLPPLTVANFWKITISPIIIIGIVLFILNFPLYSLILQKMKLAIAFPLITSLTFLAATIIAVVYLKEGLSPWQYMGIVVLAIGLWLLAK